MAKPLAAVLEETERKPSDVFGEQVRRHRDRRGWTQRDLCRKIEEKVGATIDPATLARLEKGQRRVSLDEACLLAVVLDVPLMVLMWPFDEAEPISVAPGVEAAPWRALEWAVGNDPLPVTDDEAWDASTATLVGFSVLRDTAIEADSYRVEVERGRHADKYQETLRQLAGLLAETEEIGFTTEGMVSAEVLADLKEAIARAPKRERPIRPRRGGES